MERLNPHENLRQIEADIKELEQEKTDLESKFDKHPLPSYKQQLDHIADQLARQEKNKAEALNQIQYALF